MNLSGRKPFQKATAADKKLDAEYQAWCRTQRCCVCGSLPPNDPAHVRLGGRGGIAWKPLFSACPLCRACHIRSHGKAYMTMMSKEQWLHEAEKHLRLWKKSLKCETPES